MKKLLPNLFTYILLLTLPTAVILSSCSDDDSPANSNTTVDIPPAEPNTVTFSFGGEEVTFTDTEIEGAALVSEANPNQVQKLVITAERNPENQDGYALCVEINDTNVQPNTYPVQRDSANGAADIIFLDIDRQNQAITTFNPTGEGEVTLESLTENSTTGNFTTDFESGSQTVTDATGAFNLSVFQSTGFEDVGNCEI